MNKNMTDDVRGRSLEAALAGLDWMVRTQCDDQTDANRGRFPESYQCRESRINTYTTNWTNGVAVDALLAGYLHTQCAQYLDAAKLAVDYIKSLQFISHRQDPRTNGVFREETPQAPCAHPRDALTAAWALLDYGCVTGDDDATERSLLYADWFIRVALEKGYPYWTMRFDDQPWDPPYCGSFHSGGAFYFHRLYQVKGDKRYLDAMCTILDYYNTYHLDDSGKITVIVDRDTHDHLDGKVDQSLTWQMMHRYNDDFGALANLAAWKDLGDQKYLQAAERFCRHMINSQRADGGFGPEEFSVPSAGGTVLMELSAARAVGCDWADPDAIDKAAEYLHSIQWRAPGKSGDGAFIGFSNSYAAKHATATMRTTGYAVLALLRYAGKVDDFYFFGPANTAGQAGNK